MEVSHSPLILVHKYDFNMGLYFIQSCTFIVHSNNFGYIFRVEGMTPLGDDELFFKIKDTGVVQWEPPSLYVTSCEIDVTYYPFDYQKCTIELISAMFTTDVLTLNKSKDTVNTEDYSENGEWILYSTSVEEKVLSENGENFSQLEFVLIFKRRPGYYLSNIIYPVILISLLANLAFLLPADSGERIGYVLTVLLALAVLLTLVGDSMPTTSKHTSILGNNSLVYT